MKQKLHIQLREDYYTHYFLYYLYYFDCLSRIQQLVTWAYALQADIQRFYEMYHAITSRRKLFFLSHGPNSCPFLLYYTHYITIIFYYTYYFINQNRHLGAYSMQKTCQLAHPPRGIRQHTIQEHQELNHQSPTCSPHDVRFRNRSIGIGLADVRQLSSTQFRFELITQSIDTCGNGCSLFLPIMQIDAIFLFI